MRRFARKTYLAADVLTVAVVQSQLIVVHHFQRSPRIGVCLVVLSLSRAERPRKRQDMSAPTRHLQAETGNPYVLRSTLVRDRPPNNSHAFTNRHASSQTYFCHSAIVRSNYYPSLRVSGFVGKPSVTVIVRLPWTRYGHERFSPSSRA